MTFSGYTARKKQTTISSCSVRARKFGSDRLPKLLGKDNQRLVSEKNLGFSTSPNVVKSGVSILALLVSNASLTCKRDDVSFKVF